MQVTHPNVSLSFPLVAGDAIRVPSSRRKTHVANRQKKDHDIIRRHQNLSHHDQLRAMFMIAEEAGSVALAWSVLCDFLMRFAEFREKEIYFSKNVTIAPEMAKFIIKTSYIISVLRSGQNPMDKNHIPPRSFVPEDLRLSPERLIELLPRALGFTSPGKNEFRTSMNKRSSASWRVQEFWDYTRLREAGRTAQEAYGEMEKLYGMDRIGDAAWRKRLRQGEKLITAAIEKLEQKDKTELTSGGG